MEFRLLGDLEVVEGGRPLPLGGRKQRALLAALLLDANRVVNADVLIAALWGDEASPKAPGNLHALVSRLRRTLGAARIERHAGGYLLRVQDSEVDLHRFERLRAEARLLPSAAAAERLRLALDLWRGSALADFTYDSWAGNEIQRIEELRLTAVEERVEADLESGRHSQLVGEAQGLVAEHPLRETFRRQLIVALYRSGRQVEALDAYREAQRMLDEELGLEPSPALRELEGAVLRQDPVLDAPKVPARVAPQALPGHWAPRRRLWLVAASALFAFGTAGGTVWLLDRDEGRQTVAAAAARRTTQLNTPSTPKKIVKAKSKPKAVVRTIPVRAPRKKETPKVPATVARRSSAPASSPERPARKRTSARKRSPAQKRAAPVAPRPQPPPRRPPVRVADRFDDGVMARNTWTSWFNGTGAEAIEQNGRLEMAIAPDAVAGGEYNLISAAHATTCRFLGDFDVRVDYELLDWPATNGVAVQLAAFFGNSVLTVGRQSQRWGESYTAWHRSSGNSLQTTDVRGGLRIRRDGVQTLTYHRVGIRWVLVQRFNTDRAPNIGLQAVATHDQFGHQAVKIAFDNFEISAAQPVC